MKVPVSVLIPVKNESSNLEECINTVLFSDDIVVVDSCSTDGTIGIAEQLGARVVQFDWNGRFPKKKNWALVNVEWKHDWVLILDADERITPQLAQEVATAVASDQYNGYYVNRRFMFMGKWLKHCGYYPSWNLRLFRHVTGRYEKLVEIGDTQSGDNEVHEHVLLQGASGYLKYDMLHYAYPTITSWIEKHNRYSNWEACMLLSQTNINESLKASFFGTQLERKRQIKLLARHLPFRPLLRFLYHYLWCMGVLDGYRGFVFCRLLAWYEFVSIAKSHEMRKMKQGL